MKPVRYAVERKSSRYSLDARARLIVDGQETVRQLRVLKKDKRVKAVVLRVDSPGGVVGPSQEISAEVKGLAKVKKVVVSMGSIAASGGYYVSAPASVMSRIWVRFRNSSTSACRLSAPPESPERLVVV